MSKLPGGDRAVVAIEKLVHYVLNPHHPLGKHKARVFAAAGITRRDADWLRTYLLDAAITQEAIQISQSEYGERFYVDVTFLPELGSKRSVIIRSGWLIREDPSGDAVPHLITCFIRPRRSVGGRL